MAERESNEVLDTRPALKKRKLDWEFRLGRYLVLLLLGAVAGSFTLAMLLSVYRSITAPPKVWGVPPSPAATASPMSRGRIKVCRRHLEQLSQEQMQETTALWYRMRKGHRGHLTLWQEWSRDWQRRMTRLLQRCPMHTSSTPTSQPHKTPSLQTCTRRFAQLNKELQSKSSSLWLQARHRPAHYLKGWQDWSRAWRRRMQLWLQRCPIYGEGDIAQAFRRAHTQMLALQQKQEKALLRFFKESSGLFRDIRQALHSLQEELR